MANSKFKQEIPICFATDDNYVPFLAVAITSLLDNASKDNFYRIFVLTTHLKQENMDSILKHKTDNSSIEFISLAKELLDLTIEDSRIGFEATNHYAYSPNDLREKVLNCEWLLRTIPSCR